MRHEAEFQEAAGPHAHREVEPGHPAEAAASQIVERAADGEGAPGCPGEPDGEAPEVRVIARKGDAVHSFGREPEPDAVGQAAHGVEAVAAAHVEVGSAQVPHVEEPHAHPVGPGHRGGMRPHRQRPLWRRPEPRGPLDACRGGPRLRSSGGRGPQ